MRPGDFRAAEPTPDSEASGGVPQGVQILAFLCGIVVAWLGFKSAYGDWTYIDKLSHLERMATTEGRFLQVKVRKDSVGSKDDWYPDVLYEYFIEGKSVWGWRLSYEEEPGTREFWEKRLSGYSAGATVPVYYDAAFPKDSILQKQHDSLVRIWMKMALGAGFLLAGLGLAGLSLSGWLRK